MFRIDRSDFFALGFALVCTTVGITPGQAAWIASAEFQQVTTVPANYQNSTVLSVHTSPAGMAFGSKGSNITSVRFGGLPSVSIDLPFTSSHVLAESFRFDPQGRQNLLLLNFNGPGAVWRSTGGVFSQLVAFDADQRFSRALAFDSQGNFIVSGTYGNVSNAGWIRRYDAAGNLLLNIDIDEAPIGLAFDASDRAYVATFDGAVLAMAGQQLKAVASLSQAWVGSGGGHVESFAIDDSGHFFLGVNLDQRFGQNSGAMLRLSRSGEIDTLALGYGDVAMDITFSPGHDLLLAGFNPYTGNHVVKISGDFAGPIAGVMPGLPSPSTALLAAMALFALRAVQWRRHRLGAIHVG